MLSKRILILPESSSHQSSHELKLTCLWNPLPFIAVVFLQLSPISLLGSRNREKWVYNVLKRLHELLSVVLMSFSHPADSGAATIHVGHRCTQDFMR